LPEALSPLVLILHLSCPSILGFSLFTLSFIDRLPFGFALSKRRCKDSPFVHDNILIGIIFVFFVVFLDVNQCCCVRTHKNSFEEE
jgi:hypothetical protein